MVGMNKVVALRTPARIAPELQAPVLIPPGDYELEYVTHRLLRRFRRGCLEVFFRVGDYDVILPRYYAVTITGKKTFRAAGGSDIVRQLNRLFTERIRRLDRIPVNKLAGRHVLGTVGTVKTDHNNQALVDECQYSVVRELLRWT